MQLSVKANFPQLKLAMLSYRQDVVKKALPSAINKTLALAKTEMAKQITREYVVSSAYVKARLRISGASSKGGQVTVQGSLIGGDGKKRSANLIAFVDKSISLTQARRRQAKGEGGIQLLRNGGHVQKALELTFKVKRGGPSKRIKGAFIGNKGRTVFIREDGAKRLPIKALSTIDVASMFNSKRINKVVVDLMTARFPQLFQREAAYFTTKFGSK